MYYNIYIYAYYTILYTLYYIHGSRTITPCENCSPIIILTKGKFSLGAIAKLLIQNT